MKNNYSQNIFNGFAAALVEGETFAIFPHKDPDGDALGASIGLAKALDSMGKKVKVIVDADIDGSISIKDDLRFIDPDSRYLTVDGSSVDESTFAIMLDCGEISRIAGREAIFEKCCKSFCVDHHGTSTEMADYNVIMPEAAATCELIWYLFKALCNHGLVITRDMGESVYVGILTDTGGFRYSNTSKETHLVAAEIFDLGIDHYNISRQVFESVPISRMRLKFAAMDVTEFYEDNRLAITYVNRQMLKNTMADTKDTDGIVEELRNISSVEVACLCKEQDDGKIKISMRSKNHVDVSKIGLKFSGGGHRRAAGCTLDMSVSEAVTIMKNELTNALNGETE